MNIKIPYEAFFAFYLLISSNYLGELFSCKFRQYLSTSMITKHILGLFTFGCLVIVSSIDLDEENVIYSGLLLTCLLYIWFLLSTRTHVYITLIIVILFFVMYVISNKIKEFKNKKKSTEQLEKINRYILIATGVITIIGVINYGYLKKLEVNKRNEKFNILTFIIGKHKCRNVSK